MKRYLVLWLCSLVLVALATAWISAQSRIVKPLPEPVLISGADVGIQVESVQGNIAHGKVVVRVDGKWLELGPSGRTSAYRLGQ